jgi:alpha-glucosidase/oligosaccharide 4-alpha-D-glucosyltransferase
VRQSTGKVFDDDGKTPDSYSKQAYSLLTFTSRFEEHASTGQLSLSLGEVDGAEYQSADRKITLVVHHIEKAPLSVWLKSQTGTSPIKYRWNKDKKLLIATVALSNKSSAELLIKIRNE